MSGEFGRVNKPREIEGVLDTWLIRPLGYALVLALKHTPITPNMVSVASVLAAFAAAAAWFERSLDAALLGTGFLLLTSALDSADGQLARATGRSSDFGRFFDGLCDNLSFLFIYWSIALSYIWHNGDGIAWVLGLGLLAGWCHSAQSALAEFARSLFLYYTLGTPDLGREKPEELRRQAARTPGAFLRRLLGLHVSYAAQQRALLPASDRLQRSYEQAVAAHPELAGWFRDRYLSAHSRFVGAWFLGATNVHKVGLVVAALLPHLWPHPLLERWGMVTYFVWDLVLCLPVAVVAWQQTRRDQALEQELLARAESPR